MYHRIFWRIYIIKHFIYVSTGTRKWGDGSGGAGASSSTDQLVFRIYSSLCKLLSAVPRLLTLSADTSDTTAVITSLTTTFDLVLTESREKNPFSLGVLCSTTACLYHFTQSGCLSMKSESAPQTTVSACSNVISQCVSVLHVLSEGRGGSIDALLGRHVTANSSLILSHLLSSCHSSHIEHILSSFSPVPLFMLSYSDAGVRWAGWQCISALCSHSSSLQWFLNSQQGCVEFWQMLFQCLGSEHRSTVEVTAALHVLAKILQLLGSVSAQNDIKEPLVTDLETRVSS